MEEDFEGSEILEKLGAQGLVNDFLDAVDSDDFGRIVKILRQADVDEEMIKLVLEELT